MLSLSPTAATLTHAQAKAFDQPFDQQPPDDMPDDAAAWLRTHFDWTRGAVWVASERWQVDAVTIVAWAERLRCGLTGGARAGLSSRERAWIIGQANDPDNAPTRAELARARVWFTARELAGDLAGEDVATTERTADKMTGRTAGAPVLAIRDISDAIALVAARLASDVAAGETAKAPFRALLLDDLRILRATGIPIGIPRERIISQPDKQPDKQQPTDEQIKKASARSMASHHTQPATYETREAPCALCGKPFTARKYSNGWTRYCSATCGGKARFAERQTAATTDAPTTPAVSAPAPEATPEETSETTPDETGGHAVLATATASARAHTPAVAAVAAGVSTDDVAAESEPSDYAQDYAQDYALLHTLLDRLPTGGQWNATARARFLAAFTALLDYLIETSDDGMTATEGRA